ncbi:MAG: YceH family protein [Planctomycetes bacterium]|nr:YceH family protein [Planctomycetota bacterium]
MIVLTPNECRVLGTLVEKAQTTPNQYPLTLNSLTTGCNQKNNRDPVTELSEDEVLDTIDSLKVKGLAREAMLSGSRVNKFRHVAREALSVSLPELAILTELLLRGPQSVGELRTRCERLVPPGSGADLSTTDAVQAALDALAKREAPMVRRLERRPGERAERYVQLLCPDLHPLDASPAHSGAERSPRGEYAEVDAAGVAALLERIEDMARRIEALESRLARLEG